MQAGSPAAAQWARRALTRAVERQDVAPESVLPELSRQPAPEQ